MRVGRKEASWTAPDLSGGSRHQAAGGPSPPALRVSRWASSLLLTGLQRAWSAETGELTNGRVNLKRTWGLRGRRGSWASLGLSERRFYPEPQYRLWNEASLSDVWELPEFGARRSRFYPRL